jgi:membrane-associated phospholipid phosphatase
MKCLPRAIFVCLALLALTGLVFALMPALDLSMSAFFFRDGHFYGHTEFGRWLRRIGLWLPIAVLGGAIVLWGLGHMRLIKAKLSHRALIFLVLSMALGPGLLVNIVLKDHSHRPRPVTISQFGGPMEFQPWYSFSGACDHNCSFVSGETASAVWLVAPALLVSSPLQPLALGLAGLFTLFVSLMRLAYGGHFISDILFSALLSLFIILMAFKWLNPPAQERQGEED